MTDNKAKYKVKITNLVVHLPSSKANMNFKQF